jgi:hypothetical protein
MRELSPPLLGMPPVVGMSGAVMATRSTLSADAPPTGNMLKKSGNG